MTSILNLYAGIGGNRKLWTDVDVTAVEINQSVADCYQRHFPDDEVIVGDAHAYLRDHHDEYDFIWSSVPCPTHSNVSHMAWKSDAKHNKNREPEYPDMKLYQEVIFLTHFSEPECDWVVENVRSYYEPLIEPQEVGRHYFWSNFHIPRFETPDAPAAWGNPSNEVFEEYLGFDVSDVSFEGIRKDKVLRNCVDPELGEHVLAAAVTDRQQTLV